MSKRKPQPGPMPEPEVMARVMVAAIDRVFKSLLPPGATAAYVLAVEFTAPADSEAFYWQCAAADDAIHAVGILQAAINSATKNLPNPIR